MSTLTIKYPKPSQVSLDVKKVRKAIQVINSDIKVYKKKYSNSSDRVPFIITKKAAK